MLHRARLRLQHLLGVYWFNEVATSSDAAVLTLGNSLTEQTA
jgi:hypothetical protein